MILNQKLVAKFKVSERNFSLFFHHNEFILQLEAIFLRQPRQKTNAWLNFADEPVYDDVNAQIDAFAVMVYTRRYLTEYVNKHRPAYFFFTASTARKARLYPRFAQRLIENLPAYTLSIDQDSFYFYRQN